MIEGHAMTRRRGAQASAERLFNQNGIAVVSLIVMTLFLLVIGVVGIRGVTTEMRIAGNDVRSRQALAVAEAGLSHALAAIQAGGPTLDDDLESNGTGGSLAGVGSTVTHLGTSYRFHAFGGTQSDDGYYVRAIDNFDEESGSDDPDADTDSIVDVEALGKVGPATRVVRARVRLIGGGGGGGGGAPGCAIVTNGDLKVSGDPTVTGTSGCAHANGEIDEISGNPEFQMGASASGDFGISGSIETEDGTFSGGAADDYADDHDYLDKLDVPQVRPFDFGPDGIDLAQAVQDANGYRLDKNCRVYDSSSPWDCEDKTDNCTGGSRVANLRSGGKWHGWECSEDSSANPGAKWVLGSDDVFDGAFFVEGWVNVSGNPGQDGATDWNTSIVALDSIDISGNPEMAPYTEDGDLANILFVSGNDIGLGGNLGAGDVEAGIFAHQQIKNNGNFLLHGFLVAEDVGNLSGEERVERSWSGDPNPNNDSGNDIHKDQGYDISGNPEIHYGGTGTAGFPGGGGGPTGIGKIEWSEVRSF